MNFNARSAGAKIFPVLDDIEIAKLVVKNMSPENLSLIQGTYSIDPKKPPKKSPKIILLSGQHLSLAPVLTALRCNFEIAAPDNIESELRSNTALIMIDTFTFIDTPLARKIVEGVRFNGSRAIIMGRGLKSFGEEFPGIITPAQHPKEQEGKQALIKTTTKSDHIYSVECLSRGNPTHGGSLFIPHDTELVRTEKKSFTMLHNGHVTARSPELGGLYTGCDELACWFSLDASLWLYFGFEPFPYRTLHKYTPGLTALVVDRKASGERSSIQPDKNEEELEVEITQRAADEEIEVFLKDPHKKRALTLSHANVILTMMNFAAKAVLEKLNELSRSNQPEGRLSGLVRRVLSH